MSVTIANNNIASSGTLTINNQQLGKVAFSNSYNDLDDTPSIEDSQIIDQWIDNDKATWYRKYANGFIEQGGSVDTDFASGKTITISFHVPFSTANYSFIRSSQVLNESGDNGAPFARYVSAYQQKMSTSVTFRQDGRNYSKQYCWIAFGY